MLNLNLIKNRRILSKKEIFPFGDLIEMMKSFLHFEKIQILVRCRKKYFYKT